MPGWSFHREDTDFFDLNCKKSEDWLFVEFPIGLPPLSGGGSDSGKL
jgi:hypothetical protein